MKWIKCNEQLPKERDHYLIFRTSKCDDCKKGINSHAHPMGWPTPRMYVAFFDTYDNSWTEFEDCAQELITHWMYLPKEPNESNTAKNYPICDCCLLPRDPKRGCPPYCGKVYKEIDK